MAAKVESFTVLEPQLQKSLVCFYINVFHATEPEGLWPTQCTARNGHLKRAGPERQELFSKMGSSLFTDLDFLDGPDRRGLFAGESVRAANAPFAGCQVDRATGLVCPLVGLLVFGPGFAA